MPEPLQFTPRHISLTSIILPSNDLDALRLSLTNKLAAAPTNFFTGTGIIVNLQQTASTDTNWLQQLKRVFSEAGLILVGISHHTFTPEQLIEVGLIDIPQTSNRSAATKKLDKKETFLTPSETVPNPQSTTPETLTPKPSSSSKLIRGNIRSGQRIYASDADLIVIGSVSAGAEVIADGNVHVLGILRGRAFAGVNGDENAHIFCTELAAELVSIAGNYQNMEQLYPYKGGKNCLITLNKDETMLIVSL